MANIGMAQSMKIILPLCILLLALITGCAPKETIFETPEYENQSFRNISLAISMPGDGLFIENMDDFTDDIGAGPFDSVFYPWFQSLFAGALKKTRTISSLSWQQVSYYDANFDQRGTLVKDEGAIKVKVPRPGTRFADTSHFILFLESIKFHRAKGESGTFTPGMFGMGGGNSGGSWEKLVIEITFLVWDNNAGRTVSYGYSSDESQCAFNTMTRGNWENVVTTIAPKVMAKTPFFIKR
jgi:hypothetical protein